MKFPLIRNFKGGEEFYQKHIGSKKRNCKNMIKIFGWKWLFLIEKCKYKKLIKGIHFTFRLNFKNCDYIDICKWCKEQ